MRHRQNKLVQTAVFSLVSMLMMSDAKAEGKIIQQEKISFEKCLKVIALSDDKLSIAPEIQDVVNEKRVALFKLSDGTLKITCDKVEGAITVSMHDN